MPKSLRMPVHAPAPRRPGAKFQSLVARLHRGLLALLLAGTAVAGTEPLEYQTQQLQLPDRRVEVRIPVGFELELLVAGLNAPRLLSFAPNGDLFLGSGGGQVYRLAPPYRQADSFVRPGGYPHSVAFRAGEILIASTEGVYRAPYRPGQATLAKHDLKLLAALPSGGGHSSRSVAVGPDNRVYVGLGIAGNCSDQYIGPSYPSLDRRGGILVLEERAGQAEWRPYGAGLRNPVGFDWHPQTAVLYASNNGPDHLGFELPPEYFSRVEADSFHGMPWFQYDGRRLIRDHCVDSEPPRPLEDVVEPVATFPARNAPMGVAFVPEGALHPDLVFDAIVALRGSWGTLPSGDSRGDPATRRPPGLVAVRFAAGAAQRVDDLVRGFQSADGERWARPVGVAIGPDGALYFTSDTGVEGLFRLRFLSGSDDPQPATTASESDVDLD